MTTIALIGTGEFARGLALRLIHYDYSVIFGSRLPGERNLGAIDPAFSTVPVKSIPDSIKAADVIFVCMHHEDHDSLKQHATLFSGKIVVDVSNPKKPPKEKSDRSIAENLASICPEADVVKAFNTLSAYGISDDASGERKTVYVSGDSLHAKDMVLQIARSCGFVGIDFGKLTAARQLEAKTQTLCWSWGPALGITVGVSIPWFIYTMLRYYVFRDSPYTWERLPMNITNKFFGEVGLWLLAFCYLPGCIASFIQLYRGTKYSRFPSWLDTWLKARKYLGLIALVCALMHMCMSSVLLNSAYYSAFFKSGSSVVDVNATDDTEISIDSRMSWMGELSVALGFLGTFLMAILGITSVPAIGNHMNWRQWNFMHTHIGFWCLLLCTAHVTVKGAYSWVDETWQDILPSMAFLGSFVPWVVMFLRIILWLPCVKGPLNKIRKGWERKGNDAEKGALNGTVAPMDTQQYDNKSFHSTGL